MTMKKKDTETSDYIEILNKMLQLEKRKEENNPIKITICIVGGIGVLSLLLYCAILF